MIYCLDIRFKPIIFVFNFLHILNETSVQELIKQAPFSQTRLFLSHFFQSQLVKYLPSSRVCELLTWDCPRQLTKLLPLTTLPGVRGTVAHIHLMFRLHTAPCALLDQTKWTESILQMEHRLAHLRTVLNMKSRAYTDRWHICCSWNVVYSHKNVDKWDIVIRIVKLQLSHLGHLDHTECGWKWHL